MAAATAAGDEPPMKLHGVPQALATPELQAELQELRVGSIDRVMLSASVERYIPTWSSSVQHGYELLCMSSSKSRKVIDAAIISSI